MKYDLEKLIHDEIFGFYNVAEITEVFAANGNGETINVITLIVLEDRKFNVDIAPHFIGKRIHVGGQLKKWTFGIKCYTKPIQELFEHIKKLSENKTWAASKEKLDTGRLIIKPPFFVPPAGNSEIPLNNILKNNFFNGSHVLEWYDTDKHRLRDILNNPSLLQTLSEKVQKSFPIKIASISDRLGNIVLQIPVNLFRYNLRHSRLSSELSLELLWNPKASRRPLSMVIEENYDSTVTDLQLFKINSDKVTVKLNTDKGPYRVRIFDDANNLLAVNNELSYIKYISTNVLIQNPEPRVFYRVIGGEQKEQRVMLNSNEHIHVGDKYIRTQTDFRLYKHEKAELKKRREFVQYSPSNGNTTLVREKALNDLHYLINMHGTKSVWLWDPFLSPEDIFYTLLYCEHFGSKMRAITALKESEAVKDNKDSKNLLSTYHKQFLHQRKTFYHGLNLEFRGKGCGRGRAFHDRFLIFPEADHEPLAWSLGTSINSFGKSHHILQKVSDGGMIVDVFQELWEELDHTENIIWKIGYELNT